MPVIICIVLLAGCGSDDSPSTPSISQESPFIGNYRCNVNAPQDNEAIGYGTINAGGNGSFVVTLALAPASPDSVTLQMDFTVDSNTGAVTGNVYTGTQRTGSLDGYFSTTNGYGDMYTQQPEGHCYWDATRYHVEQ